MRNLSEILIPPTRFAPQGRAELGRYPTGNLSIRVYDATNGEPLYTATCNLPNFSLEEGFVFLKGWSENEGVPEALEAAGIVRLTGKKVQAGFAVAQEAELLL